MSVEWANHSRGNHMIKIAINGFGRIGKTFLRTLMQDKSTQKKIEVVAINIGPGKCDLVAHSFKYDTLMGTYQGDVQFKNGNLVVDGITIPVLNEPDPAKLPWKQLGIDWVVECTGKFIHREGASKHITAGAKKVLISAPAHGEDISIIPGVNLQAYDPSKHNIVSLGSCSTNALVPTVYVIQQAFGIKYAFMNSIHAYTNTQALLDIDLGEARRNRAAALNIVPTTTGATSVIGKIFPDLDGRVLGHAVRVPVGKVSLLDFAFIAEKPISVKAINEAFEKMAHGPLKGIAAITSEELVSSDYSGNSYSVTIDAQLTQVVDNMGKVFGWYDNEWGYSERLKDFLLAVGK